MEYFIACEKEHFEDVAINHKKKVSIQNRKFNIKWAMPLEYFGVEIVKNDKENKVYDI